MSILLKFNYFLDDQDYHLSQSLLEFTSQTFNLSPNLVKALEKNPKNPDILAKLLQNCFFQEKTTKKRPFFRSLSQTPLNLQTLAQPRSLFITLRQMRKIALMNWFWALEEVKTVIKKPLKQNWVFFINFQ